MVQEVVVKWHHMQNELEMDGFGGTVGYDAIHQRAVLGQRRLLLFSPPGTRLRGTFGPDGSCQACPRNKRGIRFKPSYLKKIGLKPCNPSKKRFDEKLARGALIEEFGIPARQFTTGHFQKAVERRDDPWN